MTTATTPIDRSGMDSADAIDQGLGVDATLLAQMDAAMQARTPMGLKFAPGTFAPGAAAAFNLTDEGSTPPSVSALAPEMSPPGTTTGSTAQAPADATPQGGAAADEAVPTGGGQGEGTVPGTRDTTAITATPGELPPPTTFDVTLASGDHYQLTNDNANYLLQLHNWMASQPPEVSQAWEAIAQGSAAAIPAADLEAFKAWKAGQTSSQVTPNQPSTTPAPQRPQGYDPSLVPGDIADYVATLEARIAAAPATPTTPATTAATQTPPPPTASEQSIAARVQQVAAQQAATRQALDTAKAHIKQAYNLTDDQVNLVENITPTLGIVSSIADSLRTRTPNGTVIADAPLDQVFIQSFEAAMGHPSAPQLRTLRDTYLLQQHLTANNAVTSAVATKKASAGSLATAPSAAVPGSSTVDMSKMNKGQRDAFVREQMTAELADAMGIQQ